MTLPVVYAAEPADVRSALDRVRARMRDLSEPRMYQTAVMLTLLLRWNRATGWRSWGSPPPIAAMRFGKAELIDAMWQLFGTETSALLRPGSAVVKAMDNPTHVLLDVFYGSNGPLTLARRGPIAPYKTKNSVKLTLDDPSWVWSSPNSGGMAVTRVAEYNPVNSLNQQNGIRCALPAAAALATAPADPGSVYAVSRAACPKRQHVAGEEPKCTINGEGCGSMGNGVERLTTKPRLMAPPVAGAEGHLVLPTTVKALVEQATKGERKLPAATDLSLLATWCATNGAGAQGATRLTTLLGAEGIRLLTSTT